MPTYYPTPIDANRVTKFKRAGIQNSRIAEILKISLEDLESNYPVELGFTDEEDLAVVADVAFTLASSGNDSSMTKWWLSVKGGWNPSTLPPPTDSTPFMIVLADGTNVENASLPQTYDHETETGNGDD